MKLLISLYIFFSNNVHILVTYYAISNLRVIVFFNIFRILCGKPPPAPPAPPLSVILFALKHIRNITQVPRPLFTDISRRPQSQIKKRQNKRGSDSKSEYIFFSLPRLKLGFVAVGVGQSRGWGNVGKGSVVGRHLSVVGVTVGRMLFPGFCCFGTCHLSRKGRNTKACLWHRA